MAQEFKDQNPKKNPSGRNPNGKTLAQFLIGLIGIELCGLCDVGPTKINIFQPNKPSPSRLISEGKTREILFPFLVN